MQPPYPVYGHQDTGNQLQYIAEVTANASRKLDALHLFQIQQLVPKAKTKAN